MRFSPPSSASLYLVAARSYDCHHHHHSRVSCLIFHSFYGAGFLARCQICRIIKWSETLRLMRNHSSPCDFINAEVWPPSKMLKTIFGRSTTIYVSGVNSSICAGRSPYLGKRNCRSRQTVACVSRGNETCVLATPAVCLSLVHRKIKSSLVAATGKKKSLKKKKRSCWCLFENLWFYSPALQSKLNDGRVIISPIGG